eukprot:4595619-Prymnesium_polylepis.1
MSAVSARAPGRARGQCYIGLLLARAIIGTSSPRACKSRKPGEPSTQSSASPKKVACASTRRQRCN